MRAFLPSLALVLALAPGTCAAGSVTEYTASSGPVFLLNPEPLTDKKFKPFGQVIDVPPGLSPTFQSAVIKEWDGVAKVRIHQQVEFSILTIRDREHEIAEMKRHVRTPKLLLCQDGDFVILVAPRSPPRAGKARPSAEKVRAFLVKRSQAVILAKGTWHAMPFPRSEEGRFLTACRDGTAKGDAKVRSFPKAALVRFE